MLESSLEDSPGLGGECEVLEAAMKDLGFHFKCDEIPLNGSEQGCWII